MVQCSTVSALSTVAVTGQFPAQHHGSRLCQCSGTVGEALQPWELCRGTVLRGVLQGGGSGAASPRVGSHNGGGRGEEKEGI